MKNFVILLSVLMLYTNLSGQPGFSRVYKTSPHHANLFDDLVIENDTIIAVGYSYNDTLGVSGTIMMKLDTLGEILGKSFFTDTLYELISFQHSRDLIKTVDGGYAFWGMARSKDQSSPDKLYLQKIKHNGESQFLKLYDMVVDITSLIVFNQRIHQMEDGGYLLIGLEDRDNNKSDVVVIRTNENGDLLWRKRYGLYEFSEASVDLVELDNNQFVLGMLTGNNEPEENYEGYTKFIAIDSVGSVLWEWTSGAEVGWLDAFLDTENSGWVIAASNCYWEPLYGGFNCQPKVTQLDSNFNILWERAIPWSLSNPIYFRYNSLIRLQSGNLIASGSFNQAVSPVQSAVHYCISPMGDSIWMRFDSVILNQKIGFDNVIEASGELSSGSIVSCGYTRIQDSIGTGNRGWIIKLSSNGCVDTLNCWTLTTNQNLSLFENVFLKIFPNPANKNINIKLPIKGLRQKRIKITNLQGQVVMNLKPLNGEVDVSSLSPGFYSVEVVTKNRRFLGKFIKMKE